MASYSGECFCGAVGITVTGTAMAEIICHCKMCRRYHSNSSVHYVLFPYKHSEYTPEDKTLQITKGQDNLGHYSASRVDRWFCKTCSAAVFNIRPDMEFVATFPCVLTTYDYKPAFHVHYGSKILSVTDGLPKYADTPTAFGGSDKLLED
eukprot:1488-Heterococcus_DN1.PRE.2